MQRTAREGQRKAILQEDGVERQYCICLNFDLRVFRVTQGSQVLIRDPNVFRAMHPAGIETCAPARI